MKRNNRPKTAITKEMNRLVNQIPLGYLMGISSFGILLHLFLVYSPLSIFLITLWILAFGIIMVNSDLPFKDRKTKAWIRKCGFYPLIGLALFLCLFLEVSIAPAAAQWFQGAQDWMKQTFNTGNAQEIGLAIDLIFNALRGVFIIYVGVSLVKVINAAREDEDWKTVARQPMIVIMILVVGDSMVNLII